MLSLEELKLRTIHRPLSEKDLLKADQFLHHDFRGDEQHPALLCHYICLQLNAETPESALERLWDVNALKLTLCSLRNFGIAQTAIAVPLAKALGEKATNQPISSDLHRCLIDLFESERDYLGSFAKQLEENPNAVPNATPSLYDLLLKYNNLETIKTLL